MQIPILRSLSVCTRKSKSEALVELGWFVGFALIPLFLVLLVVIFTRSVWEAPGAIFDTLGRGELMIYATSVCGACLYSLRHSLRDPLPEIIQEQATPVGTLATITWICVGVAICAYLVRRMADINGLAVNDGLLTWSSLIVLVFALAVAYVTFSLKHALESGAAPVSREQTEDFKADWERERDA